MHSSKSLILHLNEIGTFCIDCTGTPTCCFSFWGGGQVVQRKGIAKAYGYLRQGALGAERSPRMEIAPALAELSPAEMGVDAMVRYGLREELDSRPCMVLQRH